MLHNGVYREAAPELFVNIFSVPNADNADCENVVGNFVNNAVVSGADPVSVSVFEFFASGRSGVLRKRINERVYFLSVELRYFSVILDSGRG